MKILAPFLFLMICFSACTGVKNLEGWMQQLPENRKELSGYKFAERPLTKEEASQAIQLLYPLWLNEEKESSSAWWNEKVLELNGLKMPFDFKQFGEMPAEGRSLYISLHGGGNTAAEVNDQQWNNQKRLYTPKEGIYLAPRAPWNDWDMWFKPGIDSLYDAIIQAAVANEGVDLNKVYLLGYSAGGDGLYRMAPRMADRWAAASMMAGHPGEASQVNLRNLPFMIWMGENDKAYDRNKWAVTCGNRLDSLQAADPSGYIHETHIVKDKGHWMDRADTLAIGWMAKYKRNPYPEKIVWRQEQVVLPSFYWLSIPLDEAKHGMEVRVKRQGNAIAIEKNDYTELTIYLNDEMFDLDKPINILYQGKTIYNDIVRRKLNNIIDTWKDRHDVNYLFPAKLVIRSNSEVKE